MEDKSVIVIGAVNIDICGRPKQKLNMRDSNPGEVSFAPGGVGRNIAHNLRLLGVKVKFIAAIGTDVYGESILKSCVELGMDMSLAKRVEGGRTSSYVYICDDNGDMAVGVSDTDIAASITPEYLAEHIAEINSADAVVFDGNLPDETVKWIADNVTAPLYADPVSARKAERLKPALNKLCAFKPNDVEAMSMTGEKTPEDAARALVNAGVKRVFVSLGAEGLIAAEKDMLLKLPCAETELVSANGAGDAAMAAIVWAGVHACSLEDTANVALKAAAFAIKCNETVNPELSVQEIVATE